MHRLLLLCLPLLVTACTTRQTPLYEMSEQQVADYLPVAHEAQPDFAKRVVHLGRRNIGQPYEIYLLGEYPFEPYDTDPLYCLQRSDCLTFAEHMYAMAYGRDWWSFMQALQRIRYRDGVIGMVSRNHFTIPDWNRNNDFLFEDLTATLAEGKVQVPLQQLCRRARFFKKFGVGQDVPDEPIEDVYVPKERAAEVLAELRDGDFVNIIRGNDSSQWCGHTGLIALGPGGRVNFLHAAWPEVREESLLGYLERDKKCLGVRFLRPRSDAMERLAEAVAEPQVTPVTPEAFAAHLAEAEPHRQDWRHAFALQSYRLKLDSPRDANLQQALSEIDQQLRTELGLTGPTACGLLDLGTLKLAMIEPTQMFYAASVGKLPLMLTYFEENPQAALQVDPDVEHRLARMTKRSENGVAIDFGRELGMQTVQDTLAKRRYRLYDPKQGGGMWFGEQYDFESETERDPIAGLTLGVNVLQSLRFFLMLEQGRLVSPQASARMRAILATPDLAHLRHKFTRDLDLEELEVLRKSGTGPDGWHGDTARIAGPNRTYLLVGFAHDAQGGDYLRKLAVRVDALMQAESSGAQTVSR